MRATQLDELERQERLRNWRNSCLALALLAYGLAATTAWTTVGNPKTWVSSYNALASAGYLAWLALPIAAIGTVLLAAAAVLALVVLYAKRTSH